MVKVLDEGRIGSLRIKGDRPGEAFRRAIVGAPTLDLAVDQVSQFTFTVDDPGLRFLDSGMFDDRARVDYLELDFEVAAVEVQGGGGDPLLTVTTRSRGAQKMRRNRGALTLKNLSPTQFMEVRAKANGLKFVGEPSAKRAQVVRADPKGEKPETDWTAGQRMATELGYWMFEAAGTLYFARPRWLIKRAKELDIRYPRARKRDELEPVQVPGCRRSWDAEEDRGRSVDVVLDYDAGGRKALPGRVAEFNGVHGFGGIYIVTRVGFTLAEDSDVSVSLATPIDPKPEPPEAGADLDGDGIVDRTGEAVKKDSGGNSGARSGQASAEGFTWPVSGSVTSPFGPRGGRMHEGIDIGVPDGTGCRSAAGGTVSLVAYDAAGYGRWVQIDHGGGLSTRYAHFSKVTVSSGQRVERGAVIGYTNQSGNAQGPHLHFETLRGGVPFNPLEVLP